ncbi:MAG: hypothetical protein JNM99_19415 [Verrucomicrobiaceae bacterium]|nr:hypothetical protein [Verrucomicrobiaceae bacterium]
MTTETLARKLGTTPHLSPLLMKARRLGLRGVDELCALAVQRGCRYYDLANESGVLREEPVLRMSSSASPTRELTNEELSIALLSICQPHSQHGIRVGAAMLGAEGNSASRCASLAIRERCEVVVRHVAECGKKVEPENGFWSDLLALLPETSPAPMDLLPHPTRFVAMTGYTRKGKGVVMQWIRPSAA